MTVNYPYFERSNNRIVDLSLKDPELMILVFDGLLTNCTREAYNLNIPAAFARAFHVVVPNNFRSIRDEDLVGNILFKTTHCVGDFRKRLKENR